MAMNGRPLFFATSLAKAGQSLTRAMGPWKTGKSTPMDLASGAPFANGFADLADETCQASEAFNALNAFSTVTYLEKLEANEASWPSGQNWPSSQPTRPSMNSCHSSGAGPEASLTLTFSIDGFPGLA